MFCQLSLRGTRATRNSQVQHLLVKSNPNLDHDRLPFQWLAIAVLLAYCLREPFAGAVQFYLGNAGLGFLWFVPDGIALLCVVALLAIDLAMNGSWRFFFLLVVIAYYMLLGYITIGSVASALSGFKALLPLLSGILITRSVFQRAWLQFCLVALLVIAMAGVWWSVGHALPWAGSSFDSGLGTKSFRATVWASGGGVRPFGFSSDQHYAASSILFLFAFIGAYRRAHLFYWLAIPVVATVYISTSRTSLLALVILIGFRILLDLFERGHRPEATRIITAVTPFLVPLLPISVMAFAQLYSLSEISSSLESIWVRGSEVFLQPVSLMPIFAPYGWLFGFGLGGVGFPVMQSNYSSYLAIIDNFLLFSYYSFGVPFLLYYLFLCRRNAVELDMHKRIMFCVVVLFGQFILGWANGMFMMAFGYAASAGFVSRPILKKASRDHAYKPALA